MLAANCMAATHYVRPSSAGASDPYTSWGTAGTSIITVVNAALTNTGTKVIWVTNGTYYLSNQVAVSSALTLQSVNGRDVTIVDGNNYDGKPVSNRCFYLTASGTVLDGFTLTNGFMNNALGGGGGVYCAAGVTVKNCRITGCVGTNFDIAYPNPGWENSFVKGPGVYVTGGVVTNCEIIGNSNYNYYASVYAGGAALVVDCTIANNITHKGLGGEGFAAGIWGIGAGTVIENCKIYGNTTTGYGMYGGGVGLEDYAIVRNSLVYGNSSSFGGGIAMYGFAGVKIQSCTVVSNTASDIGGGIFMMAVNGLTSYVENTVSYFNTCAGSSNIGWTTFGPPYTGSYQIVNSCIAPTNAFKTTGIVGYYYVNNIEVNPQFAGKDTGDWRLTKTSPCVNAGTNETWMDGMVDLDLHSRIDRFARIVDMGCYEYLPRGTMVSGR